MPFRKFRLITAVTAAAFSTLSLAAGPDITPQTKKAVAAQVAKDKPVVKTRSIRVEKTVDLKIHKLQAVKGSDGKVVFLADTGRFAFLGPMVDVWNRQELRSIEDIEQSVNHIDPKKLGLKAERIAFTLGQGGEDVWVFIDPKCGWCHKLADEVAADKSLLSDYRFNFVVVPILGDESAKLARKFYCAAKNDGAKFLDAYRGGDRKIDALEQEKRCDPAREREILTAKRVLDIASVPFLIAPDGRFMNGKPSNLRRFIEGDRARIQLPDISAISGVALPSKE